MKKKSAKVLMLFLVLLMVTAQFGCAKTQTDLSEVESKPAKTEAQTEVTDTKANVTEVDEELVIGIIPVTMDNNYHVAASKHDEIYAMSEYNAKVKIVDGKLDIPTIAAALDELIAEGVDGIIIQPHETASLTAGLEAAAKAGIPVLTFYEKCSVPSPHIYMDEAPTSAEMGKLAAEKWLEYHSDKPIVVGCIDYVDHQGVQNFRTQPFINAVKKVYPNADIQILDGGGTAETAFKATQDLLQSHPEINIFYGASSTYSLAAAAALEEAGRGVAIDGIPQSEIICGIDGTESEMLKIYDPSSSYKITMALTPLENAKIRIDTIMDMISGEINPNEEKDLYVYDQVVSYWGMDVDEATEWLAKEYFSTLDIKAEIEKK